MSANAGEKRSADSISSGNASGDASDSCVVPDWKSGDRRVRLRRLGPIDPIDLSSQYSSDSDVELEFEFESEVESAAGDSDTTLEMEGPLQGPLLPPPQALQAPLCLRGRCADYAAGPPKPQSPRFRRWTASGSESFTDDSDSNWSQQREWDEDMSPVAIPTMPPPAPAPPPEAPPPGAGAGNSAARGILVAEAFFGLLAAWLLLLPHMAPVVRRR
jgi:hypothetical protein